MSGVSRQPFASLYFFPVAAAYAAIALPWSVFAHFGLVIAPSGLTGPLGHAHEMLFGFAMAVVAGYVLGPQSRRWIGLILGLWLSGRLAFLGWPARHCLDRPDLIALMTGYLWLVLGWLLIAAALLTELLPLSTALHGLTVGALGTLTLTVMARTRTQRSRKDSRMPVILYLAVGMVSLAALARLAAGTFLTGLAPYLVAAVCWSLAFLILLGVLLRLSLERRSEPAGDLRHHAPAR